MIFTRRAFIASLCALAFQSAFAADFVSDRIAVSTEGTGSDVVLIHGLSSSTRVWRELTAALPGHRYHLVQIKGFAGVPKEGNGEGAVLSPVAEEINRYIAVSGLNKPAVIGHSMGGTLAMMLAARHPDALGRLMVVDMFPFLGAMFGPPGTTVASIKPTADAMLASMRAAEPAARQARSEATLAGMINTVAMRPGAIDDTNKSDPDLAARAFHELIVTDLVPELAKVNVPSTVLYVIPKGVPVSEAQMDAWYKAAYAPLKNVNLKRIPNSAHFIMWDQPAVFQAEVKAFLTP